MRIIFAGTPEFALPTLEACLSAHQAGRHELAAVYTQPDRPAGRGRKLTPSPVKQRAQEAGVSVIQPLTLKTPEAQAELAQHGADLMVVIAYGLILPLSVLAMPRLGCVNLHASLLPRWRGAAPIQRALLAGDAETGVCLMRMDVGLDTGAVLQLRRHAIAPNDTAGSLHDALAQLSGRMLADHLDDLAEQRLTATTQSGDGVVYAKKLDKTEARLDWTRPATELERQVRGYNPWPVAHTVLNGQVLRIWGATVLETTHAAPVGAVISADRHGIRVACGEGVLNLTQIQWPGGRVLSVADISHTQDLLGARFA